MSQFFQSIPWKTVLVTCAISAAAFYGYRLVPVESLPINEPPVVQVPQGSVGVYVWTGSIAESLEDVIVEGLSVSGGAIKAIPTGSDGFTEIEIPPESL